VGRPPVALDIATEMRKPNRYWLGKAILRLAFGETLKQRVEPIVELLNETPAKKVGKATAVASGVALFAAALASLFKERP